MFVFRRENVYFVNDWVGLKLQREELEKAELDRKLNNDKILSDRNRQLKQEAKNRKARERYHANKNKQGFNND